MKVAIVGAGAAGLSLGVMLQKRGVQVTIFERELTPGGLCKSTYVDGFTFDTGPHILGGIPEAVDWIVESTGLDFVEGHTNNYGWINGEFVKHPFEDEAVGLAYVERMWKCDPKLLDTGGLSAQKGRKPGGVSTFLYPRIGGYGAITDAWTQKLDDHIRYNTTLEFPRCFDHVVWTAPRAGMRYNSLMVSTFLFEGQAPEWTAVYFPGNQYLFHRMSCPSNFSPNNAPNGCFSLQTETSCPRSSAVFTVGLGTLLDQLAPQAKLLDIHEQLVQHAYPVPIKTAPVHENDELVHYHGRTGAHKYINIDGVVADSMKLAEELTA